MTFRYPASDHHPRASAKPAAGFARPPSASCVSPPSAGRTSAAHQSFLNFVRYLKGDREAIGDASYLLARHRAETALLATDRVLALLYRVEAIADHRIDNDVAAVAKLYSRPRPRGDRRAHQRAVRQSAVFTSEKNDIDFQIVFDRIG